MPPILGEWLHLALRWAHVVAAIMWIGDSFLFMWMDASLEPPAPGRAGDVQGELWMTHSGGFYEVVKHRTLAAPPRRLHWFMWPSYTTWLTGVALLVVVYGLGERALLLDEGSRLSHAAGIGIALATLVAAVPLYELLARGPAGRDARVLGALGLALVTALAAALGRAFTPHAAFLLVGAALGTIMSANVLHVIIPAQHAMVAALRAGRPAEAARGAEAKRRSIHNHYLTLPVLFTMLSGHFPAFYGHPQSWAVLGLVSAVGAGAKAIMNRRLATHPAVFLGTLACLAALAALLAPPGEPPAARALAAHPPVSLAEARDIVQTRCAVCHASHPAVEGFAAPPAGVMLDTDDRMRAHAGRILARAYLTRTMPPGNATGMTDDERATLAAWAWRQRHP